MAVSGRVKTQKQLAPAAGTLIFSRATMGHLHRNKNKSLPATQVGQGGRGGGGGYSATGGCAAVDPLRILAGSRRGQPRGGQTFSDDDARHAKSSLAALTIFTGRNYATQTGMVTYVGRKVPLGLRI